MNFHADGSCKPNPGKGAYGWFTPKYQGKPHEQLSTCTYPLTIMNCESLALSSVLSYIKDNPSGDKTITDEHFHGLSNCSSVPKLPISPKIQ